MCNWVNIEMFCVTMLSLCSRDNQIWNGEDDECFNSIWETNSGLHKKLMVFVHWKGLWEMTPSMWNAVFRCGHLVWWLRHCLDAFFPHPVPCTYSLVLALEPDFLLMPVLKGSSGGSRNCIHATPVGYWMKLLASGFESAQLWPLQPFVK